MGKTQNWSLSENVNEFCVNGRLLPSLFFIGIQKCGTTTLDGVLSKFPQLSHGKVKEHQLFSKKDEKFMKIYKEKINRYPECNTGIVRSYDGTPNYANPNRNATENIKRFYGWHGIPVNKLIFIAMLCPNFRRISSVYYRPGFFKKQWAINPLLNSNIITFNKWFDWILKHQDQDHNSRDPLSRGFYDEIFAKYFKLFPNSTFLLIDSQLLQEYRS